MKISKDNFFTIGKKLLLSKNQVEEFWSNLEKTSKSESLSFAKYLYYFGAMIVISAMTWFMDLGWELFGGGGVFFIALAYALIFTIIGKILWKKNEFRIPAGLFITLAVCMVPLAIYGLETYFNFWPRDENQSAYQDFYRSIKAQWVLMELGTIFAGLLALYFFPFPFLTAPIFFASWFLIMDLAPFFFGTELTFDQQSWISLIFGFLLIVIGVIIGRRKNEDYAFWSIFFGTLSFAGGLGGIVWNKNEGILFIYFIVNLIMMGFSILIRQSVLMVVGALGVFFYLSHLAYDIFEDSILFPFVLSIIGVIIIFLGVLYQKNSKHIENIISSKLPPKIKTFFDVH